MAGEPKGMHVFEAKIRGWNARTESYTVISFEVTFPCGRTRNVIGEAIYTFAAVAEEHASVCQECEY